MSTAHGWYASWLSLVGQLSESWIGWLIEATVWASLVIGLILLTRLLLGRRLPAVWLYVLWSVLLLRLIIPWTPESPLSAERLLPHQWQALYITGPAATISATIDERSSATPRGNDSLTASMPGAAASASPGAAAANDATMGTVASETLAGGSTMTEIAAQPQRVPLALWLALVWLLGWLYCSGRLIVHVRSASQLRRAAGLRTPEHLQQQLAACAEELQLRRYPELRVSAAIASPALVGVWRPILLVPEPQQLQLSAEQWHYILLHELVHFKRRDALVNWLMALLVAVHWFNPLLWYAARQMRADQELACDAAVLRRIAPEATSVYGQAMLGLLEQTTRRPAPSLTGFAAGYRELRRRIDRVRRYRRSPLGWSIVGVLAMLAIVVVTLTRAPGDRVGADDVMRLEMTERGSIRLETNEVDPSVALLPRVEIDTVLAEPTGVSDPAELAPIVVDRLPEPIDAGWAGFRASTGYGDQGVLLLAPRHWIAAAAEVAADGTIRVELTDPQDARHRLIYTDSGSCQGCAAPLIETYFTEPSVSGSTEQLRWRSRALEGSLLRYELEPRDAEYPSAGVAYSDIDRRSADDPGARFRQLVYEGPAGLDALGREMLDYFEARQQIGEFLYVPDREPVAVSEDGRFVLYGMEQSEGMYLGHRLVADGREAVYDWSSLIGETRLTIARLDGPDSEARLVVTAMIGSGTGGGVEEA
ncbi:DUF4850 domain-containing protein, partial [Paenibacillus sp. 598K]|uniref:DUF4850 domain-containing protein n=1 Tax=Paenibacillus sp. 598K TaxID=1117987 RepID=UPI000FFEC9DE